MARASKGAKKRGPPADVPTPRLTWPDGPTTFADLQASIWRASIVFLGKLARFCLEKEHVIGSETADTDSELAGG